MTAIVADDLAQHADELTAYLQALVAWPVLNVPSGFASNGVPTGVQVVGRRYDDLTTFRIGAALETVRPWFDAPQRGPRIAAEVG